MLTRRECLKQAALATGCVALYPSLLDAFSDGDLITRVIPSTGQELPVVGLGSSTVFSSLARREDNSALRDVLRTMFENGGRVIDTAPSYGASEEVAGSIVRDLGAEEKVFWATKLNVAGRSGGKADPDRAREQVEDSFQYIGKNPIDLIQVHKLADIPTQMNVLKELKDEGRVRYIGATTTHANHYPELARVMKDEPIDFIGVDYAVDDRVAAEQILPLAAELGIATLIYVPFGGGRLFARVRGHAVPEWALEFGANSWAQFFLKYILANPAVTCVTPATNNPKEMLDNLGAAYGDLPNEPTRRRMERTIDALPSV